MWSVDPLSRVVLICGAALCLFIAEAYLIVAWANRVAKKERKR